MVQQTMDRFRKFFEDNDKPMLLDGATGTELMKIGLEAGECGELWNFFHLFRVRYIAASYFYAGSDAVLTNTFGAISTRLKRLNPAKTPYDLNRAGAMIPRYICPNAKFVIGNIGPSSEVLEPYGNLCRDELINAYAEQVKGLIDGRVDAFSLETFTDLNEMECAIQAIEENSDLPFMCSMTFKSTPRGYFTEMGVSIKKAADTLYRKGAFAIGSNCGNGIVDMIEIAKQFRQSLPETRLIFQPNAGKPQFVDGKNVYDETPEFFESHMQELMQYRPSIIGGCCGTTPEHIRMMRGFLDRTYR